VGYSIGNNEPLADTSLFRYVFNFGIDASTKAYATWNDVKNKAWAIDGVRHVFEPFIQASYIPQPNVRPSEFAGYDNRINTTESRPLNSTLYNSIDSIDKLLIVRPGMMNRVLTKRDGSPYELANWKVYTDFQPIRPDLTSLNFSTVQAPETVSSSLPELYNILNFMPVPWWTGTVGATTAISGNGFNSLNLGSRWQVVPALEIGLGYSYLDGFNYLNALNNTDVNTTGASQTSLINGSASYRLNESWFANAGVTYSVSPSLLQQVNVGVYRDIGAWILGGQIGNRQNNGAPSEFVALATLTLKAFPDLPLGFNQNPTSSGVGLGGVQQTAGTSSP
jgi:LPS-assembly protein